MSRLRWYLALVGFAVGPAVAAAGACGGSSPDCGAGMQLVGGACVAVTPDAGPDTGPVSGPDAGPDTGPVDSGSDAPPDVAAPDLDLVFAGIASVSPASQAPTAGNTVSLSVTWDPAQDPFTLPGDMGYSVYLATTSMGEHYAAPAALSIQGVTSVTIAGLVPGTTYYAVVRATNKAGDQDQNTHELSASASADTTAPGPPGTPVVVPRLACQSRVTWAAATDTGTSPAGMRYSVYLADGTIDLSSPAATTLGTTTVDVPVPGATSPYHQFVVVAEDAAGNLSSASGIGAPNTATLSFESSVQPILTNDCAPSCHTVNTTNKLTPVYDDGYAYQDIMGPAGMPVFANVCKPGTAFCGPDPTVAACSTWLADVDAGVSSIPGQLIFAGEPQCSVLYQVAFQKKMPPKATGLPTLSTCDTTLIHDWILAGALP